MTVNDFCDQVNRNLNGFVLRLQKKGFPTSTPHSYEELSRMLTAAMSINPAVGAATISSTNLLVEYQLPQAAAYCDVVLLGSGHTLPQAIIIELKDYDKNMNVTPGAYEGLMWRGSQSMIHPSDQVKGYVEYCRNFHSAVVDIEGTKKAEVSGCVFLTKGASRMPYQQAPNGSLAQDYPVYDLNCADHLSQQIANTITGPDSTFATAFEQGTFIQNRNIMLQVAKHMRSAAKSGYRPFVLLDEQRKGFNETLAAMESAVGSKKKTVIIVQGPPGSGKSAVAINLLLESIQKYAGKGNIFFVTTSLSQHDNWKEILQYAGKLYLGRGIQKSAASFKPQHMGSVASLSGEFPQHFTGTTMDRQHYEKYVKYVMTLPQKEYDDNVDLLTITDEAHALVNPLSSYYCGHRQGFANYSGPEAYHIIRRSQVSVFFTDPEQSFRDFESTSIQDIEDIGKHLGAEVVKVNLGKLQFRCAGSVDYVDWVDNLFTGTPLKNHDKWDGLFDVKVFEYPSDLEAHLRSKSTKSVRLLSSYSREWVSEKKLQAIHKPGVPYDFDLMDKGNESWQKYWNNPNGYEVFVQAQAPSSMSIDPLCEVGCPYVVRGFDYDYVGVLMLDDIVWRNGKWMINLDNCKETATQSRRAKARDEHNRTKFFEADNAMYPKTQMLFDTIRQAYRILMTRGIKGMYLCIPDKETRDYIKSLLKPYADSTR